MKKRIAIIVTLLLCLGRYGFAQRYVNDKSVIYQQERMVFKQWNQNDFTPTHGFLWLNPLYWLTWAWHPNYHKNDLRPLGPVGPQTQRLALVAAMQNTDNAYKLQADTLRNTAISEALNYSGVITSADPFWLLYYSKEFKDLLNQQDSQLLTEVSSQVREYLVRSGTYAWYLEQSHSLAERLNTARSTTIDRGSRILTYYRLMAEYRRLNAAWTTKKQQAGMFLALSEKAKNLKSPASTSFTIPAGYKTDQQIADEILSNYKL
jgi:murein DD-endopeptidase MepM/ murein hydrolase activator NlpD